MTRQLLRLSTSIPLRKLKQGGTLTIRSSFPRTILKIIPEWRDDGIVSLHQSLFSGDREAQLKVTQKDDFVTSMGRSESHMAVEIFPGEVSDAALPKSTLEPQAERLAHPLTSNGNIMVTADGSVLSDSGEYAARVLREFTHNEGNTFVTGEQIVRESSLELTAWVPEKVNLTCNLSEGGTVSIDKKIEGDIHLFTKDGDVTVNKLRGHYVSIITETNGVIYVSDLIEAQNVVINTPGRLRAKRIHGTNIDVQIKKTDQSELPTMDIDDEGACIDISSLYVSGAGGANLSVLSLKALDGRAIRVKSSHGHVTAETSPPLSFSDKRPLVELGGVNGSCDVYINSPTITYSDKITVGRIHVDRLSPNSVSFVTSTIGNLELTFDRKVESDLRLLACADVKTLDTRALLEDGGVSRCAAALKELDESTKKGSGERRISINTDAFSPDPDVVEFANIDYVEGRMDNKSMEPDSRFDVRTKGDRGVGKISLEGAASQSLSGFSPGSTETTRPLFAAATNGKISAESLSWLGAIARRYGLEQDVRDLGRTASRKGRSIAPTPIE